ncbi:MAG: GNAT family N-acetyltransferase [bacterium]|nr:GNAT family N-acetyltransferase [bacterium]
MARSLHKSLYDTLSDGMPYLVEFVQLETILELRRRVLAPGQPAVFPEDCSPTTLHIAIFPPKRARGISSGTPVCCASFVLTDQVEGTPYYQLRGMATDPKWQKRGLGSRLLAWTEQHFRCWMISVLQTPTVYLWCNARVSAVPFYEKQGWRCTGDVFDIPYVGPHRRMDKYVLVTGGIR